MAVLVMFTCLLYSSVNFGVSHALVLSPTNIHPARDANASATGIESYNTQGDHDYISSYSQSQVCLAVVIAAIAGAIAVLLATLLVCLWARRWFNCRRCSKDVGSMVEEQTWSKSTMTRDSYQPWWLATYKQQQQEQQQVQQQHQQQIPVLHRGQSWSTTTTICNNHNDVVSPMDSQIWDEIQQNYQVSPSSSYMFPVIYPPTQSQIVAQQQPVELPTTPDPGNTPLPSYPATMASAHLPQRFSWTEDEEASYRPSAWAKR